MNSFDSGTSFKLLLTICKDNSAQQYESAWREFFRRYKKRIYQIVVYRSQSWLSPKTKVQLKDIANDIVAQVFIILPKALESFREVSNEKYFLLWIGTICNRAVSAHFKRNYSAVNSEIDIDENPNIAGTLPIDNRWELFEFIKETLTENSSRKKNVNRDLSIFLLYTWGNFSEQDIKKHHCFKDLGNRVVEVTVNRQRNILKKNKVNESI